MNGKCGVCDRPKGRGYGECSAPDSTDYTVSILCLSVALQNARAEVATAEERGRRSGVEKQADLLLECEEALVWCSSADAFSPDGIAVKGWQRIVVPVLERLRAVRKNLAPRDSVPQPDRVATLFDAIKHGDETHRAWLKQAIEDHFAGRPVLRRDEVRP